jgi:hypothetical protein
MKTRPGTPFRLAVLVLVAAIVAAVGVQGALATTPNDVQYKSGVKGAFKSKPKPKPAPLNTAKVSGTLPFTGVDLAVISIGGVLVLMGGVALRRFGRKSSEQS